MALFKRRKYVLLSIKRKKYSHFILFIYLIRLILMYFYSIKFSYFSYYNIAKENQLNIFAYLRYT